VRAFSCPTCALLVFVDNDRCLRCGTALGYDRAAADVVAVGDPAGRCANHGEIGCSWLPATPGELCPACALTRTRPPADDASAVAAWAEAERAKRMLVFQADELGLDLSGVTFDLKSGELEPVLIGHADGVVTIDVTEADDVTRVQVRERMGEAYRTMLGHFRHEIGHYLWMTMVDATPHLEAFRQRFGDERADYGEALQAHYAAEPPPGWQDTFVSAYATAHPWEDFAETVAHYLHIRDTLQTAAAFGIEVHGDHPVLEATPEQVVEVADDAAFEAVVDQWLPLTYALNAINRSMGLSALYPFVLAPAVVDKLAWVHDLVTGRHVDGRVDPTAR
jgi:hypothetical protein